MKQRYARRRDETGSILVLSVVGLTMAVIATALSVDIGRVAQERRRNQRVADMAALDAVRTLVANPLPADPQAAVQGAAGDSAVRNTFPTSAGYVVAARPGIVDAAGDFVAGTPFTAVEVKVTSPVDNAFAAGGRAVTVTAVATVGNGDGCALPELCENVDGTPIGTVRVGSRLVSANSTEATVMNRLLERTVGGSYDLNAVGWEGISNGNVQFSRLRTALGYGTGSTDGVLDTNFKFRRLLDATVDALNADGSASSITAANRLAQIRSQVSATAGADIQVRRLFAIVGNVGSGMDVADARINVLDIVRGGLILADGDHFATVDLGVADVGAVPGLQAARVYFGLIEAPRTRSGPPALLGPPLAYRTVADTAQVRLIVELDLNIDLGSQLGVRLVKVPYYLDAGRAQAKLHALNCVAGEDTPTSVDVWALTQAGSATMGAVSPPASIGGATPPAPGRATLLDTTVSVLGLGLVRVQAAADPLVVAQLPGNPGVMRNFSAAETAADTSKPVAATGSPTLTYLTANDVDVTASAVGIDLLTVESNLIAGVNAALPDMLAKIVQPTFRALGLSYAGADVWAPPPQDCDPSSFNVQVPPDPFQPVPVLIK